MPPQEVAKEVPDAPSNSQVMITTLFAMKVILIIKQRSLGSLSATAVRP